MPRDVIVAQLVIAMVTIFHTVVFASGYYKDLGGKSKQTDWRITSLLYKANRPAPASTARI